MNLKKIPQWLRNIGFVQGIQNQPPSPEAEEALQPSRVLQLPEVPSAGAPIEDELRRRLAAKSVLTNDESWFLLTGQMVGHLKDWTPARRARRPQRSLPSVPGTLHNELHRLYRQEIWSVSEARSNLGPLAPLVARGEIRRIATGVGPGVVLGLVGRRRVGIAPGSHFAPAVMTDLLYLRLAAQHHGWIIVRMPSRRHGSRSGRLDRLAVAERDGRQVRLLACCVDGGYARSTVLDRFEFLRSGLMSDQTPLVVLTPNPRRLASLQNHDELLEIVHFPVPSPQSGRRS